MYNRGTKTFLLPTNSLIAPTDFKSRKIAVFSFKKKEKD